jgi:alkanesulfonate monooxygenase SsuD/methylene tetrahydromethanopterin reductase-like flavin-dependent oxidoreductase (luciferase family)
VAAVQLLRALGLDQHHPVTVHERRVVDLLDAPLIIEDAGLKAEGVSLRAAHISGGRLELSMGPGGSPADHRIVEEPLWSPTERLSRFEEAVQIVDGILRRQLETFDGRYYRVDRPSLEPPPVQQPRPPLTLGVQGRRTLRLAAAYADVWSTFGAPDAGPAGRQPRPLSGGGPGGHQRRNDLLDAYCAELGRDPATIVRSFVTGVHAR